jgi:hypothetical protein
MMFSFVLVLYIFCILYVYYFIQYLYIVKAFVALSPNSHPVHLAQGGNHPGQSILTDRDHPLGKRLPDAFYVNGRLMPLMALDDAVEVILYAAWGGLIGLPSSVDELHARAATSGTPGLKLGAMCDLSQARLSAARESFGLGELNTTHNSAELQNDAEGDMVATSNFSCRNWGAARYGIWAVMGSALPVGCWVRKRSTGSR